MRFFLLSLILNLILLFIPLNFKTSEIQSKKEEKIEVAVNFVSTPIEPDLNLQDFIEEPQIEEPKIEEVEEEKIEEIKKIEEIVEEEAPIKKEIKEIKKVKKEVKKPKKKKPIPKKKLKADNFNEKNQKIKTTSSTKVKPVNFCQKNVGFKVLNERASYDFPKKAIRLGIKGRFSVNVSFVLQKNGIKVVKVVGENKVLNDEATRLTKRLRIKLLSDKAVGCVVIKPFIFTSN